MYQVLPKPIDTTVKKTEPPALSTRKAHTNVVIALTNMKALAIKMMMVSNSC